jgi:hypothetical protein
MQQVKLFKKKNKKYPLLVIMNLVYDILDDPAPYVHTKELRQMTTIKYVQQELDRSEGFYSKEELDYYKENQDDAEDN